MSDKCLKHCCMINRLILLRYIKLNRMANKNEQFINSRTATEEAKWLLF